MTPMVTPEDDKMMTSSHWGLLTGIKGPSH
jgi:hypothetical protein